MQKWLAGTLWRDRSRPNGWPPSGTEEDWTRPSQERPTPLLCFQFSHSLLSHSLGPHGLQQVRLPCPSSSPGACSNSYPLSQWCYPTISSSVAPFSCPQSFPTSESFPMSPLFFGAEVPKYWSFSTRPSNEYSGLISFGIDWFDLLGVSKGLSRIFSNTTVWKHQFLGVQPSLWSNSHIHTWQWKNHSFD